MCSADTELTQSLGNPAEEREQDWVQIKGNVFRTVMGRMSNIMFCVYLCFLKVWLRVKRWKQLGEEAGECREEKTIYYAGCS